MMARKPDPTFFFLLVLTLLFLPSCSPRPVPVPKDIVSGPAQLAPSIMQDLGQQIGYIRDHDSLSGISASVFDPPALERFYRLRDGRPAWSLRGSLLPAGDSLLQALRGTPDLGLVAGSYHYAQEQDLLDYFARDSSSRLDAAAWARMDLLLTDGLIKLCDHLHYGVIPRDSLSLRPDSSFSDSCLAVLVSRVAAGTNPGKLLDSLQPRYGGYDSLLFALDRFRANFANSRWDPIPMGMKDSSRLYALVAKRLLQSGELDSGDLGKKREILAALKRFQFLHNLYPDAIAGPRTIAALNKSPAYRIRQIGVNLERWRHWPDSLPPTYVLVNIPSFSLEVWDHDTLVLGSRVIVGKPDTRTPELNSRLVNFIIYPYWRVPRSIAVKEMLPAIKKDYHYLIRNNLEVIDRHNKALDPSTVNWKRYNRNFFPFLLQQSEGIDNSLGILKFNFVNKYGVFLHDTNARDLFSHEYRAYSHGCIRMQQWQKLMYFLVRDDTLRYSAGKLDSFFQVVQKKQVTLRTPVPIYVRYFSCREWKGRLYFYDDLYGEDAYLMRRLYGN